MAGPLDGIRIVEMTSVVLGPWACQILADMGADVVRIESPAGDSNRELGASRHPGMAALYLTCNRNKRSIVLDVKQPQRRQAVLDLVHSTDVFIHNNRPQAMSKLGLDFASTIIADKTTAITVVYAVLAALFSRERTGMGQEIEVPMFETMVSYVMAEHLWGMAFDPPLGPPGYVRMMSVHRRPYPTRDGSVAILPYMDAHWEAFCDVVGHPQLKTDSRFRTMSDRTRNIDETYAETEKIMAQRTTAEWLGLFADTNVPISRVNTLEDLATDPHLVETGFWKTVDHPTEGRLRMTGFPVHFESTPVEVTRRHAPRLGEHTRELLHELGYAPDQIDAMLAAGAAVVAN